MTITTWGGPSPIRSGGTRHKHTGAMAAWVACFDPERPLEIAIEKQDTYPLIVDH